MKTILFAAMVFAAGAAMADKVQSNSKGDELRLLNLPCAHGKVLSLLAEKWRPLFKKAQAIVGGKLVFACWIDIPEDSAFWVLFESGVDAQYRMDRFRDEPGA